MKSPKRAKERAGLASRGGSARAFRRALVAGLLVLGAAGPSVASASAFEGEPVSVAGLLTSGGVRVALHRYRPVHSPLPDRAVLLLPDVGMTRRAYDFENRGLARHLRAQGWEVYVLDWRGAGLSEVPYGGFDFEDLLERDAEAAFQRVSAGGRQVILGGAGLGGTIALLLAARHPDEVQAVIALQAAATLEVPNEPVARLLSIPELPPWLSLPALSGGRLFGERTWFEVLLASDGSLPAASLEGLRLHVLAPVPRRLALQVGQFMRERRISVGGVDVRELIAGVRAPTLLMFAPRDNWIHPEFSTPLRQILRSPVRVEVLGRLEGAQVEYGHLGMLLGTAAARDVYAPVVRFLDEEGGR